MTTDPLYSQILDRLSKPLHGELFERCVSDLLREHWPTLIPVVGGGDGGKDGAFIDGNGPGLLIATTQQDVIGNVTRNLTEHCAKFAIGEGRATQALVATSQALSPKQCKNIADRVRKLGFHFAHDVYTREAIANLLYHNSRCLKDLLGITGGIPALSKHPRQVRPFAELPLIGRDKELEWLRNSHGDRLILGQPGIGKTFLASAYAEASNALFAVTDDADQLANAIRDQAPPAVIVEDAHLRLQTIAALQLIRKTSANPFDIIADCWPDHDAKLLRRLAITSHQCIRLERLRQKEILAIVSAAGIARPDQLPLTILHQSLGSPGLASTLANLAKHGGRVQLFQGHSLANWAYDTLKDHVGDHALPVLAAFAIGGDEGMTASSVAKTLNQSLSKIKWTLSHLAWGGIVHLMPQGRYRVIPEPLRSAVINNNFFGTNATLSLTDFVDHACLSPRTIKALIYAHARAAKDQPSISLPQLFQLVYEIGDSSCWNDFLSFIPDAANFACSRLPTLAGQFPISILTHAPQLALPEMFFTIMREEYSQSNCHVYFHFIEPWITSQSSSETTVKKRAQLWQQVQQLLRSETTTSIVHRFLPLVVQTHWSTKGPISGSKDALRIQFACVPLSCLTAIRSLWDEILKTLESQPKPNWSEIFEALDQWVYPQHIGPDQNEEFRYLREQAGLLIQRLVPIAGNHLKALLELEIRAEDLGIDCGISIDPDFKAIFTYVLATSESTRNAEKLQIDQIIERWLQMPAAIGAARYATFLEFEASLDLRHFDHSSYVTIEIAKKTNEPETWLSRLESAAISPSYLQPFLTRIFAVGSNSREITIRKYLCSTTYEREALGAALGIPDTLSEKLERILEVVAARHPLIVNFGISYFGISPIRLRRYLYSSIKSLSSDTASAMWTCKIAIPEDQKDQWRKSALMADLSPSELESIASSDDTFIFDWFVKFTKRAPNPFYYEDAIDKLVSLLPNEQWRDILLHVLRSRKCKYQSKLIASLVGVDLKLFEKVVTFPKKRASHISLLCGKPQDIWAKFANLAIQHGYSAKQIVEATTGLYDSRNLPDQVRHDSFIQWWEQMREDLSPRLDSVVNLARQTAFEFVTARKSFGNEDEFRANYGQK